jgi:hypothetical protein
LHVFDGACLRTRPPCRLSRFAAASFEGDYPWSLGPALPPFATSVRQHALALCLRLAERGAPSSPADPRSRLARAGVSSAQGHPMPSTAQVFPRHCCTSRHRLLAPFPRLDVATRDRKRALPLATSRAGSAGALAFHHARLEATASLASQDSNAHTRGLDASARGFGVSAALNSPSTQYIPYARARASATSHSGNG